MGFQSQLLCSCSAVPEQQGETPPPTPQNQAPLLDHAMDILHLFPSLRSFFTGLGFVLGQTDSSRPKDSTPSPSLSPFAIKASLSFLEPVPLCMCPVSVTCPASSSVGWWGWGLL